MARRSVAERAALGRSRRAEVPRRAHGDWSPAPDRRDPVALIEAQDATRLPWLVPLRHARMRVSPFTFYRGAARVMAADLAHTPVSGLTVQAGGDAHLSNFGAYASPERQLVFDQNDFDETLPGPWEWDLKRLATSVMIAGQHNGFSDAECRALTDAVTRSYREALARFAAMGFLELWYDHVTAEDVEQHSQLASAELGERLARFRRRAMKRNSLQALAKLAEPIDGTFRIRSDPPVLVPLRDLPAPFEPDALHAATQQAFEDYTRSVDDHLRVLLGRYELVDVALKVVGVGSVGTRCFILLLIGRDDGDPLFLQGKEAGPSVLEEHLGPSRYDNAGRRVVEGQRLIQAQSDIFLGWTSGEGQRRVDYYVRQLRDWKGSAEVEALTPDQLRFYAELCGLTLARGHARSGDAEAIRAYAGKSDTLDRAITAFAERYAEQNRADHEAFCDAIASGRLEVADTAG